MRGRKRAAPKKRAAEEEEKKREEEGGGCGGGSSSGGDSKSPEELKKESTTKGASRGKRVKAPPKPKQEPEFFREKRNLEDLWQAAFPVGTEWENMDKLQEINWNFSNLEDAFEEGGELYGKTVYLFGSTEPQLLVVNGEQKVILIPIVVAVVSPIPPSDKIGIKSVQRENEEIVPMKAMKMAWVPYVPLENRQSRVDRLKTQIFTLGCTQRRSALKHLKTERVKQYDYCLPYFQPLKADDDEEDTVVNIMFPLEPPVVCDFDWELDDLEDFTDELIKDEALPEDQKDAFKDYVKEQVRETKKTQKQAREARRKAIEDMDPKTKAAFENMQFYKFYPVQTLDTPDISSVKVPYINRYYGKAHVVM
ncbi:hypothetical protein ACMD2_15088 [Ananas comosus]|uniref:Putative ATP/GTP binding protein n=1 Tax=Ananas comosus TaxID=4615 RepID=Q8H291_ANACO|nr:putative ATP/GTP binding protein [Ananas comosus]OAY74799.1 hypothetical protein ACMD2_15088 [Ananas comosus]